MEFFTSPEFLTPAVWVVAGAMAFLLIVFGLRAYLKAAHSPRSDWTTTDLRKLAAHMNAATPGGIK